MFAIFRNGTLYGLATRQQVDTMHEEAEFAGGLIVMEHVQSLEELQTIVGREFNTFETLEQRKRE